jgi:Signal transduction histidine kinase
VAKKIPFKVSARTARLIGRENVSNFDGAIIELIKNSYDAIASACVIFFNNKYNSIPETLNEYEYKQFVNEHDLIKEYYLENKEDGQFTIKKEIKKLESFELLKFFRTKNELYIIDNGTGMTEETIEKYWMTIGTNNKESDFIGTDGRVKTGAKGIGRFALDRLGSKCVMVTLPKNSQSGSKWRVNWNEFEKNEANIDDVYAEIENIDEKQFLEEIAEVLSDYRQKLVIKLEDKTELIQFNNGTLFKISDLRDDWDDFFVEKLYSNLETLIPPTEENVFNAFLFSSLIKEKYGQIQSVLCDDYDYKIEAKVIDDQNVNITIHRNEFDIPSIDKDLFGLPDMKEKPFDQETLLNGFHTKKYNIRQLLKGYDQNKELFNELGPFNFTLYFLKRSNGTQSDRKKFFNKIVSGPSRVKILDKFGGIKLYRDFFRIRPYGEPGGDSFDWLKLGDRADKSPGGPTQSGGGRLRPNQVLGIINISRLTNINFEDKSSREGLQENESFVLFKELITNIINLLESDRSKIMKNMQILHSHKNVEDEKKKQGTELATKIVKLREEQKNRQEDNNEHFHDKESKVDDESNHKQAEENNQKNLLADSLVIIAEENKELQNELQLSRTLASTGLVITSFAHELQNLSVKIERRTDDFIKILEPLLDKNVLIGLEDFKDPYVFIEDIRKQDEKLKYWLDFALRAIKKDKRTLIKVELFKVLEEFKNSWEFILNERSITMNIPLKQNRNCYIRMFETDIETLLNNLLTNSFNAFNRRDASGEKNITIEISSNASYLELIYKDSGPGLSTEITDPYEILNPFFTTKRDRSGKEIGTGMGMWLIKSVVEYYNGDIVIFNERPGFRIKFRFPIRTDEGVKNEV